MSQGLAGLPKDILEDAANLKANNEGLESLEEERAAREASLERQAREQERDLLRGVAQSTSIAWRR